jgi:hypothetical protein
VTLNFTGFQQCAADQHVTLFPLHVIDGRLPVYSETESSLIRQAEVLQDQLSHRELPCAACCTFDRTGIAGAITTKRRPCPAGW